MLVARFSDNIQADINRNWSAWMLPSLAGSYEECVQDAVEFLGASEDAAKHIVKEFPEFPGCYGCIHHEGLSCYLLEADNIEDAVIEVKQNAYDGSGYGVRTVGTIALIATIRKEELNSVRDLHILQVDDSEVEKYS